MNFLLYFVIHAIANRLRGGAFDDLLYNKFGIAGNTFIRISSAVLIMISIPILFWSLSFPSLVTAIVTGICWYVFHLFSWGLWHDMSNSYAPLEEIRKRKVQPSFLKTIYIYLLTKTQFDDQTSKFIMMTIRGLFLVVFLPIMFYYNTSIGIVTAILLSSIFAFGWASSYFIGRNILDKYTHNHATEVLSAIVVATFLMIGFRI